MEPRKRSYLCMRDSHIGKAGSVVELTEAEADIYINTKSIIEIGYVPPLESK